MSYDAWGEPPEPIYTDQDKALSFECLEEDHTDCPGDAIRGEGWECNCTCHDGEDYEYKKR